MPNCARGNGRTQNGCSRVYVRVAQPRAILERGTESATSPEGREYSQNFREPPSAVFSVRGSHQPYTMGTSPFGVGEYADSVVRRVPRGVFTVGELPLRRLHRTSSNRPCRTNECERITRAIAPEVEVDTPISRPDYHLYKHTSGGQATRENKSRAPKHKSTPIRQQLLEPSNTPPLGPFSKQSTVCRYIQR